MSNDSASASHEQQLPPAVIVEGLVKSYYFGRIKALDGVDLRVEDGDVFALIGPNGAGKTTLMGCMLALLRTNRGRIRIFGKAPDHIDVRKVTGFLPERPSFESWMNATQFLKFHQMLAGRSNDATAEADIKHALESVELENVSKRQISKYSRGMLQRLGLAQVIIGKPRICFLDEPTSGMDPPGMDMVRNVLTQFRKQKVTVIVNSHHLDEIERVCTRFAFIRKGKMETQESISNIHSKMMIARWANGLTPDADVLKTAMEECGVTLADVTDEHCKIVLNGRQNASNVIQSLVRNNISIEEIFFDRRGLSDLFKVAKTNDARRVEDTMDDEKR
ncbi:MAG: ABC transporter ATP-binding protein [Candidatus Obscuribacterales bacterium]|nr:ABC transporter ATP-binding protein [Candidatus Obscuribacterales bacterium]